MPHCRAVGGMSRPAGKAAALAVAAYPDWSSRRIAEAVGVAPDTVDRLRKSGARNQAPEKRLGRNGVRQTAHKKSGGKRRPHKNDAATKAKAAAAVLDRSPYEPLRGPRDGAPKPLR
jgi:hypothetical protein